MHQHTQSNAQEKLLLFQCGQCEKAYKRPEHLQRHKAVHKPARDYRCPRCGTTFQRSDVLSRHAKTCFGGSTKRQNLVKRACDACVQSKRKCSAVPPCSSCRRRDVPCVFTAVNPYNPVRTEDDMTFGTDSIGTDLAHTSSIDTEADRGFEMVDDDLWSQFLSTALSEYSVEHLDADMRIPERPLEQGSLGFLESFTSNTGLLNSFDCLTHDERSTAYAAFLERSVLALPGTDLMLKSHEIVMSIKDVVQTKPRNSPIALTWSPSLEAVCVNFFSPRNIYLWLELYWAIWHPNVNYMHRPTFDVACCKAALLVAMSIMGALVSPEGSDRERARLWMNCVEEMVFQDDDVCCNAQRSSDSPASGRVQAMQAM